MALEEWCWKMKKTLDGIQKRAVNAIMAKYKAGKRAVLLVGPPGAGKTEMVMGVIKRHMTNDDDKVLICVHQRELAVQTMRRLSEKFGADNVTAIMAGYETSPHATIHVGTVQTILKRPELKGFTLCVLDEAHHYVSHEVEKVDGSKKQVGAVSYATIRDKGDRPWRILGATATPERADGTPLGDLFEVIVKGGDYSELIANGRLVRAHVVEPERDLGSDWAMNPVDAWARNGGGKAFFFAPTIKLAEHYAEQWNLRRVPAMCISERTKASGRAEAMNDFASGNIQIITCVGTMLEGIDIPDCRMVILGRSFHFRGTYLQATGRVLRAHPGKERGIVVDLTGAKIRHGDPDQDREYQLFGDAISGPQQMGGPGGGGGGVIEPEVVGVKMLGELDPIEIPDPDPLWWERKKRMHDWYRRNVKRFGKKEADRMALEMATEVSL